MPNLIVERGREKGTSFELKADAPCVAGRDPASVQIVISDPAASRRHFQVAGKNGKWFVSDLQSRNHTYLNENKLDKESPWMTRLERKASLVSPAYVSPSPPATFPAIPSLANSARNRWS